MTIVFVTLLVAAGLGILVVELSYAYAVGAAVVAVGAAVVISLIAWGFWSRKRFPRFRIDTQPAIGDLPDDGRFRTPRIVFNLGLLSSCWLVLRIHGVTISDALFLVALALATTEQTLHHYKKEPVLTSGIWIGIALFVAGGTLSTIANSHDTLASLSVIVRVFYLIAAWFWVGGTVLRTRMQLWRALGYWVVSAAVCGTWAAGQKFGHLPGGVDSHRFAGLSDHVNDLGALTACALVPALVLAYKRWPWLFAVAGITAGLILSGSIGAGMAALVALGFGLVSRDLTKPTMVALGIGAVILILVSPVIGASAITRFSTATNSQARYGQDTLASRVRTYKRAWRQIRVEPFLGTGLDTPSSQIYDEQNQTYYQVHNLFLGRWYDSGILGIAGILLLVARFSRLGWHEVCTSSDRYLALALFAGFVAYLGAEMSEPSLYKRYSLVPVMLTLALRRISALTLPLTARSPCVGSTDVDVLETGPAQRKLVKS